MENKNKEQLDALTMTKEYIDKLIPALETVISEIKTTMQEDTVDFLMQITDGFNFVLEAYNVTSDLLKEEGADIDDVALEGSVNKLSAAFGRKDYKEVAGVYEANIIPFLTVYKDMAAKIISK